MSESLLVANGGRITREELALVPTPPGTATHKPIPHIEVITALVETLGFRHISVVRDEYAVSRDGMKMFGVMELDQGMHGARFALGIRNAHDKSFRLAVTVGYRVFVCENLAFSGDFAPVLAKHSKHFRCRARCQSASTTCSATSSRWWKESSAGCAGINRHVCRG